MRIFLRPLFSIAATKFLSSHEFMEERSMGSCPGNTARSCGHIFPLKAFVSTVVKITGTSNTLAAFPNATVLLMTVGRNCFTSKSILWLIVDQGHNAIARCQKSLLTQLWTIAV